MQLGEFLIEDRLEKYRLTANCNLGESGLRNFTLSQLLRDLEMEASELEPLSLNDSPNRGREDLREAVAELYPGITKNEVLITTGTGEALFILFHLLLKKQDIVRIFLPAFQALYEVPKMLGARIQGVDASYLDIEKLLSEEARLYIINHPHNPSGQILDGKAEERINRIKNQKNQAFFLFDEHYRFLDYQKDLGFSGASPAANCFSTGSITKCFGVMGLKIGWLIASEEIIEKARSFKDYLSHTVSPISEYLSLMVLRKRQKLIIPIKKRITTNLSFFSERVREIPSIAEFIPPGGGLVAFPRLQEGILSENYADELLKNCGVFTLPGANFEREGFLRIGFGEEEERFQSGIERWIDWEKKRRI